MGHRRWWRFHDGRQSAAVTLDQDTAKSTAGSRNVAGSTLPVTDTLAGCEKLDSGATFREVELTSPQEAPDTRDLLTRTKRTFRYRLIRELKLAIVAFRIRPPRKLGAVHQLFQMQEFLHDSGLISSPSFQHRSQLYEHLNGTVIGKDPIEFLEFGVFKGASIRQWLSLNQHADSRFYGFDSFEGLPERWEGSFEKGYFSTGGKFPDIEDHRVTFVKGLFQDTLGRFLMDYKPRHRLIVHIDADLYTSTLYVLATLNQIIQPGSIIIFDEFGNVNDEFRACMDYIGSFRRKLTPIGWAEGFYGVAAFVFES
jgi:O-methyltransferase